MTHQSTIFNEPAQVRAHAEARIIANEIKAAIKDAESWAVQGAERFRKVGLLLLKAEDTLSEEEYRRLIAGINRSKRQIYRWRALAGVTLTSPDYERTWAYILGNEKDDETDETESPTATTESLVCSSCETNGKVTDCPTCLALNQDAAANAQTGVQTSPNGQPQKKSGSPYKFEDRCEKCQEKWRNKPNCKACDKKNARGPNDQGRVPGVPYCNRHTTWPVDPECIDCLEIQRDWREKRLEKKFWTPFFGQLKKLIEAPSEILGHFQAQRCPEADAVSRILTEGLNALKLLRQKVREEKANPK